MTIYLKVAAMNVGIWRALPQNLWISKNNPVGGLELEHV
jgi:hypothetical protein